MDRKLFWNNLAKRGAILGAIMLLSRIVEQSIIISGNFALYVALPIEFFVSSALYIYLLYRYTKSESATYDPSIGFSYFQGMSYIFWLSVFAGIIVGAGAFLYTNVVMGYEQYIASYTSALERAIALVNAPSSLGSTYAEMIEQIRQAPQPTAFDTLFSSIWAYSVTSLFISLFIAGFTQRKPRIFNDYDSTNN